MATYDDRPPQRRTGHDAQRSRTPHPRARRAAQGSPTSTRRAPRATSGRRPGRPTPGGKRPALRILALIAALVLVVVGVSGCVVYNNVAGNLPDPTKPLKGTDLTTRVLDRHGKTITLLFADQNRQYVELKDIPRSLQEAVIATEDQRYYEHPGVDLTGMLRALWTDLRAGSQVQGGSTITQQYVKQAFVGDERSIKRKLSEAILAYRLEQEYSKDKILEMYLNTIYFGHGSYGVQTAAKAYFGTSVDKLSVAEVAVLAGVIKSPARYSPYLQPTAAKDRRDTVLGQMRDQGYIDATAYAEAVASPIKTAGLKHGNTKAPYFVEYLKTQLVGKYGEEAVYRGGLTVTTTLDLRMQTAAENAVKNNLNRKSDPSASLVALDPKTGQIVAMVGGRDFEKQQYNVAVQGHRQSGSAFKPFVLASALSEGVSPEATFTAGTTSLKIPGGQTWKVTGEAGYSGPMRLRPATWHSINPVFAQLVLKVGADTVVDTARDMGITTKITPVPAVALGGMAEGVTPLEMASAYGTLANGGTHAKPIGILKVTGKDGATIFTAKTEDKRALDAAVAFLTTDILKGVISSGTGTAANIGRPAAGKTGTTQEYRDAWFCGYTPDLAASVWVGYTASQREMTNVHGIRVTGGSFPARIWASFMRNALKDTPSSQFKRPSGIVEKRICLDSGQVATSFCPKTGTGLFISGDVPGSCTLHNTTTALKMPNLVGLSRVEAIAALAKLGAKYSVVELDTAGVAPGTVTAQTPPAGTKIVRGATVTLTVTPGGASNNRPPTAAFSANPGSGSVVRLDASASRDDGAIVKWVWDFGDGSAKDSTSGKVVNHSYAKPGSYDVTLSVTDDSGATASRTKKVNAR